jgi:uncharacterized RDD family membrane protein YckC
MLMLRSRLVALLFCLLLPVLGLAAEPQLRAIYLEGIPHDSVWLLQTFVGLDKDNPQAVQMQVWAREEGSQEWFPQSAIPFDVVQVTHAGQDLVALLANGQWLRVGQATGQPLPQHAKIVSMVGNEASIWAVGQPAAPATQPTSRPKSATTLPNTATQPVETAKPTRSIYQLNGSAWKQLGQLPPEVSQSFVLGLVRGRPALAWLSGQTLQVWQFGLDGVWTRLGERAMTPGLMPLRLFEDGGRVLVFCSGGKQPSELLVLSDSKWLNPIPLATDASIRTMGIGGGTIRFAYADSNNSIKERRINLRTFAVEGADTAIALPHIVDVNRIWAVVQGVDMTLIVLVMIYTYRRREQYQQTKINWGKYAVCPIGRRAFAGMIDLAPVLAMLVYIRFNVPHVEQFQDVFLIRESLWLYVISLGVYLLHTTVIECIFGRSIGKIVSRMYVVRIDGGKPSVLSLLVRNLLRIIDVTLPFTPIVAIYLPLRQRLGDLGAGTVVICDREDNTGPDA